MAIKLVPRGKKVKYIIPMLVGFLCSFFKSNGKSKKKNPLVLVGGHLGEAFDDNSKAMYLYLANHTDASVYWMKAKDSNYSVEGVREPNISVIGSIKAYYLYFSADYVFFSHSNSTDIAPLADHIKIHRPFEIYISHGIEALKKPIKGGKVEADLFTAASSFEKSIKVNDWKLPERDVKVTGMARFDTYKPTTHPDIRRILFLPTWREWELRDNGVGWKDSETYKHLQEIFLDGQLQSLLQISKAELVFHPHPFMQDVVRAFHPKNTAYTKIDSQTPISKEIEDCDALITDYSSVAIDFLYLKKPIIFYQFDQSDFLKYRGSYLDYKTELFGPVAFNEVELRKEIKKLLNRKGGSFSNLKIRNKLFDFYDRKNCERIWRAVVQESKVRGLYGRDVR